MIKLKLSLILVFLSGLCMGQKLINDNRRNLDKRISLDVTQQPVSEVLDKMSKAGDFYFSYSGRLFHQDSLVSLRTQNKPVRDVLDKLFAGKVDYKEIGEHVILRYAASHFTIEPENITNADQLYLISGFVVDTETGKRVKQASVYEKRLLQSTLTDDEGYFKLRFKGEHPEVILTASKENYRDTSLIFLADIKVRPEGYNDPNEESATALLNDMTRGFGHFLLSSRQKMQSINIPDFFASMPFQASLTPGLRSHGSMSSQVVNKFSLNVLGGYTAGIDGIEIAGLFNITKGDVNKLQIAGLFNGIGGSVKGLQLAGLANDVRTDIHGIQISGLLNHVRRNMEGIQVAGLTNIVSKSVQGIQVAGLINISSKETEGIQLAGLGNCTSSNMQGMQISGLLNYSKEMDGVQIGLVNINGRSSGYSIGLINYSVHGYHKISISATETINTNISLKTGNSKLYNIILAGKNYSDSAKIESYGLGFGHDLLFGNRLSIAAEVSAQYLYLGNWNDSNILSRFQTNLQVKLIKGFTVFGGPAYSVYRSDNSSGSAAKGYSKQIGPADYHRFNAQTKGWWGWNVGLTLF